MSIAQNAESVPLENFLHTLEKRFDVVFTYADENVRGIAINIPQNNLTLQEYLDDLGKHTGLIFNKLNSRYIAIQKRASSSFTITLTGTVIDKNTREHLIGAVIQLGNNFTLSNSDGWFSVQFNPNEDSMLTIRYTGYKNLVMSMDEWENSSDIYALTNDILKLDEVVVNYIATGIDKLVDGAIQMNTQNIDILPGMSEPDILHTAQVLPGIFSVNETVSYLNTRGGTNDQSLVLWEGVKMYQTGHLFGLISGFNSHLINKTTFINNGTSAAYGDGVSGTIDMKQQDYPVNKFNVSAGFNMLNADIILKVPVSKKLTLLLGARSSINDAIITPTYKSYYKRAFEHTDVVLKNGSNIANMNHYHDFSFYDLNFKLIYNISDRDKVRLSFLDMNDEIEYEVSASVNDTLYKKKSHLNQSSLLSDFDYAHQWNKYNTTHLSAYVSSYNLYGYNAEFITKQNHEQKNEVLEWGIKMDSKCRMGEKVNLAYGYKFNEVGIRNLDNINKPNYSRDVKAVLDVQALYSEVEFNRLFNKFYMRFGARAVYLQKFKMFIPEPRVVLNFKLTDHIACEALAEKKSQYTTQLIDYQSDFLGVEKRRWALSNNNSIPVLKSLQFSFGMQYNCNHFLLSVDAYRKKVDGIITPSQGFQNQFQYVYAIGNYHTEGIEALINKRFKKSNIWLNYSLERNSYYFKDLDPTTFPNNIDIMHIATLGGSYMIKNFDFSSGFNFRTGKPYTMPLVDNQGTTTEIIYEYPNSSRLDNFIRLDVSSKYNFHIKKVNGQFGVSVWNVLNRKNIINIYYVRNNNGIEQVKQQALGITPNLNLRLSF